MLRYFLALVVVIGHSPLTAFARPLNGDGGLAVQSFYVISGFYMSLILNKYRLHTLQLTNLKDFYFSRFLRIYPIYWICFVATLAVGYFHIMSIPPFPVDVLKMLGSFSDKIFYLLQNVFIFGQALMRFMFYNSEAHSFTLNLFGASNADGHLGQGGSSYLILGQAWSLSLELTFYLLVPFLLTRKWYTVMSVCVLSLSLRFILHALGYTEHNYDMQVAFFPTALGIFLLGSLSHQIIYPLLRNKSKTFLRVMGNVFVALIMFYVVHLYKTIGSTDLKYWCFVGLVTLSLPFLFSYFAKSKFDRMVGELSFPVYMIHFIFIGLIARFHWIDSAYAAYWVILLSTITSILLVCFVVMPLDNFRHIKWVPKTAKERDYTVQQLPNSLVHGEA